MSRFNNAESLIPQARAEPVPPQQRPEQFIADLQPKVINSFKLSNVIRPHNIVHKQLGMVDGSFRMSRNVFGSSAFSSQDLPPMKANNFI